MVQKIQQRRGTASQWTTVNPVLAAGEIGGETDTHKAKLGDGTTVWNSLPYIGGSGTSVAVDADGTVTIDGTTVELATDSDLNGAITSAAGTAAGLAIVFGGL